MRKFTEWLCKKKWAYDYAVKLIANRIVHGQNQLKPEYLKSKSWVQEGTYWVPPGVKERDKIWIQFEHHYYRVFHGSERTFIALESTVEWFEVYYMLSHGDRGRYKLSGI